jgi:hypothetical protein
MMTTQQNERTRDFVAEVVQRAAPRQCSSRRLLHSNGAPQTVHGALLRSGAARSHNDAARRD